MELPSGECAIWDFYNIVHCMCDCTDIDKNMQQQCSLSKMQLKILIADTLCSVLDCLLQSFWCAIYFAFAPIVL